MESKKIFGRNGIGRLGNFCRPFAAATILTFATSNSIAAARMDTFAFEVETWIISAEIDPNAKSSFGISEDDLCYKLKKVAERIPQLGARPASVDCESSVQFNANVLPPPGKLIKDIHIHVQVSAGVSGERKIAAIKIVSRRGKILRQSGPFSRALTVAPSCAASDCVAMQIASATQEFMDFIINYEARADYQENK